MQFSFTNDWVLFGLFFALILIVLALADFLLKKLNITAESTRRIVHILVGVMVSLTPFLFISKIPVLTLAIIFIVINAITLKLEALKGMNSIGRTTYGTVYFPISFAILILWFWDRDPAILITSMYIMTFADPIASWIGEASQNRINYKIWSDTKSLQGSSAMFLISFIVTAVYMAIHNTLFDSSLSLLTVIVYSLFVAAFATVAESVSHRGTDNLTVPLGAALILDFLFNSPEHLANQLMFWMIVTTLIAYFAYKFKTLTLSGSVGAWVMGTIVFGMGGIEWMIPMVTFFALSSLFSKLGKKHKDILVNVFEKGSQRDIFQVFANGGIGMSATLLFYFTGNTRWYLIFLASVAAATADTWATEIGTFSKKDPRFILNFKTVPMGTSGGISIIGTFGAAAASVLIAFLGLYALNTFTPNHLDYNLVLWISLAAFIASLVDSVMGATIQSQYRCPDCGKQTERRRHCGNENIDLVQGYRLITNDSVNFLATLSAGILMWVFLLL